MISHFKVVNDFIKSTRETPMGYFSCYRVRYQLLVSGTLAIGCILILLTGLAGNQIYKVVPLMTLGISLFIGVSDRTYSPLLLGNLMTTVFLLAAWFLI